MTIYQAPTPVSIDKVCMFNYEFSVKDRNALTSRVILLPGDDTMHVGKRYYNDPTGSTVELMKDRQGKEVCKLTFNPNKVGMDAYMHLCNAAGVSMNIGECRLIRLDIARDSKLQHHTRVYHDVFQYSMSGRVQWSVSHGSTCRVHNNLSEIGFYNKSIESNLPTPGVHRLEVRLKKSTYIRKAGVTTFSDLLQYDTDMLLEIYRQNGLRILPKLMRKDETLECLGDMVTTLEQCFAKKYSRPLDTFLSFYGLMHITPEAIKKAIDASNISKQKKYHAKKRIDERSALMGLNSSTSFVQQEIINYFAA